MAGVLRWFAPSCPPPPSLKQSQWPWGNKNADRSTGTNCSWRGGRCSHRVLPLRYVTKPRLMGQATAGRRKSGLIHGKQVLFATGDTLAQQAVEKVGWEKHNLARTGRMALYGGGASVLALTPFSPSQSSQPHPQPPFPRAHHPFPNPEAKN